MTQDTLMRAGLFQHPEWLNLRLFFGFVLRRLYIPVLTTLLGGVMALMHMRTTPPYYEATMLVAPKKDSISASFRGGGTDIGRALSLGHSSEEEGIEQFTEILTSVPLARMLDEKHQLRHILFGGLWDAEKKTWRRPEGAAAWIKASLRKMAGRPEWQPPSIETVAAQLHSLVTVAPIGGGALYEIRIRHQDPAFAIWLLKASFAATDDILRTAMRERQEMRSRYILGQLNRITDVNKRKALFSLLNSAEMSLVMANSNEPVALDILQLPYVGEYPAGPSIGGALLVGLAAGGLLGSGMLLMLYIVRRSRL